MGESGFLGVCPGRGIYSVLVSSCIPSLFSVCQEVKHLLDASANTLFCQSTWVEPASKIHQGTKQSKSLDSFSQVPCHSKQKSNINKSKNSKTTTTTKCKTRYQRNFLLLRDKWHRAVTDSEDSPRHMCACGQLVTIPKASGMKSPCSFKEGIWSRAQFLP